MKKPPLDVDAAARLSNFVKIRDVSCVELHAAHRNAPAASAELSLAWATPNATAIWGVEGSTLKVLIPLFLVIDGVENGDQGSKTRLAEMQVTLRLDYEVDRADGAAWSDDDLPHFAGIASYLHAWPYFRAEVQALTTKLGFPPLVLPVIVSGHAAKQVTVQTFDEVKELAQPKSKGRKGTERKGVRSS